MASRPMKLPTLEKSDVVTRRENLPRVLSSLQSASFLNHRHQGEGGPPDPTNPNTRGVLVILLVKTHSLGNSGRGGIGPLENNEDHSLSLEKCVRTRFCVHIYKSVRSPG